MVTARTSPKPSSIRNVYTGRFRRFRSLTPMFAMREPGGPPGLNGLVWSAPKVSWVLALTSLRPTRTSSLGPDAGARHLR